MAPACPLKGVGLIVMRPTQPPHAIPSNLGGSVAHIVTYVSVGGWGKVGGVLLVHLKMEILSPS